MKIFARISLVMMILAICLFTARALSPEYVDEQGLLHEPFFLVVLGWLALLIAVVTLLLAGFCLIRSKIKEAKTKKLK